MSDAIKKVLVYRALSFMIGFAMSYLWFGAFTQSFGFMVTTMTILTVVHYFFERWWVDESEE